MKKELLIADHRVAVYEPDHGIKCPVIYMHTDEDHEAEAILERIGINRIALICIKDVDWNRDMSPWPAPKAFKRGEDFAGQADAYLDILVNRIARETEKSLEIEIETRGLIGYSLSGLFALYALYKTDIFSLIGSMSGSMWYDNWLDFMQASLPKAASPKVYLSLGDKESKTRDERLSSVEACTLQAEKILRSQGAAAVFEMNPGNHFVNVAERMAKGIGWLIKK
jgi:predicted alpha/beta superfamily hydrolase